MPDAGTPRGPVLLTGATGFVGQTLQTHLLAAGFAVRVLVRRGSPRADRVDARAQLLEGDLGDAQALARGLAGTKAVINCAGSVRGANPEDFAPANVDGVRALASAIQRLTARPALLHISSLAASQPDLSDYAASKRAGEQVLTEFPDLLWTVFRPPAIYGPGDVELRRLLNSVRRGIVPVPGGNRNQRLSLLHVDDLARAVLAWLDAPARSRHHVYALDDGHPNGYSWPEIAEAVCSRPLFGRPLFIPVPAGVLRMAGQVNAQLARLLRRKPMLTAGKARELTWETWLCDNSPFSRTSGWAPAKSLKDGVASLYD
jgi:nucleoside-diphosphate-sugar epimerase